MLKVEENEIHPQGNHSEIRFVNIYCIFCQISCIFNTVELILYIELPVLLHHLYNNPGNLTVNLILIGVKYIIYIIILCNICNIISHYMNIS